MNSHKNARLSLARRVEMIHDITQRGLNISAAALAHGVTPPTVRKWLGRFLALGESRLIDASSRSTYSPRAIASGKAPAVVELRHRRLTQARIAAALGCPKARSAVCWRAQACRALLILSLLSLWCAMSMRRQETCCTSTPKSSGASFDPATV